MYGRVIQSWAGSFSKLLSRPTSALKTLLMSGISKPLTPQDGAIVWIDCEMTGLDYKTDRIIEIAVLITNKDLELVDDGVEFVIRTDKSVLDGMNPWCIDQHGKSGLTQACLDSTHEYSGVRASVLSYVKGWIPEPRTGVLAGSSVHCDKAFLTEGMPDLVEHLHYRIIDVSTIKELARRWYPATIEQRACDGKSASNHRALDDIRGSIAELQYYRQTLFKPASDV